MYARTWNNVCQTRGQGELQESGMGRTDTYRKSETMTLSNDKHDPHISGEQRNNCYNKNQADPGTVHSS